MCVMMVTSGVSMSMSMSMIEDMMSVTRVGQGDGRDTGHQG